MNQLKLSVHDRGLYKNILVIALYIFHPVLQKILYLHRTRWHISGFLDTCARTAYPVLIQTELARTLILPPDTVQENAMDLSYDRKCNRMIHKIFIRLPQCRAIIDDLIDILVLFTRVIDTCFLL